MDPKDGDRMANIGGPEKQHDLRSSMIWVYTVCLDLFGGPEEKYDLGLHCLPRPVWWA